MGKGRINITKKGDFHFSFKAPFLTMKMDTKIGNRWRWDERFLLSITAQVVLSDSFFCLYELFSASERVRWKLDFIIYRTCNQT